MSVMFLTLCRIQKDTVINCLGLHVKYHYSCHVLMKPEFCRGTFEKYKNIKFNENPPSVTRVVPCERADRQIDRRTDRQAGRQAGRQADRDDEANSRFSQFCERT